MTLPVVAGGYTVTEKNYNDVSKANVKVTYKVGNDEAKEGTEAAATVVKGGNTEVDFNNLYPDKSGKLIITKTFGGPVVEADFDSLTFEVKKTGATTGTEYKLSQFTPSADKKTYTLEIALTNDELGEYTVTETNYNDKSGVAVEVTHKIGADGTFEKGTAVTTSIGDNDEKNVIFNNEYPEGNLIIKKTFGGPVVPADLETLSFDVYSNATKETKNYTLKTDFTKVSDTEYTMTLPVVAGGYIVTEKNYNEASGAAVKVTYKVNEGTTVEDTKADATVTKGGNTTVAFNNEYLTGALEVTKVVEGQNVTNTYQVAVKNERTNAYYDADGNVVTGDAKWITVIAGTKKTFTNLPKGKYTVEENTSAVDVPGFTFVAASSKTSVTGVEVTESATAAKAELKNVYSVIVGSLTINKTVTGNTRTAFRVTVQDANRNYYDATGVNKGETKTWIDIVAGTALTIEDLPLGAYTVTEDTEDAKIANYVLDADSVTSATSAAITADVKAVSVDLSNKYSQKKGVLRFEKTFGGPVVEADKDTLSFLVTKVGETTGTTYMLKDMQYDENTKTYYQEITLYNDDLGDYTIIEQNYNKASGAAVEVTYSIDGSAKKVMETTGVTVGVADGETKTVAFDNEYPSGKLTIHVSEEKSGQDVPNAEVEVKYPDGSKKTYKTNDKGEVTDENGKVLEVLPGDYEVTVTKVPDGYDVKTGVTGTVTVPKNDEGHHEAVIVTNRGALLITVTDEVTGLPVEGAEVEVTTPDGKKLTFTTDENGQVTEYTKVDEYGNYTAETGEYSYKVTKIPVGYHVTVGEEQSGTVVVGKLTELESKIAPKPEETGKISVHVTEERSGLDVPNATVEVTDENGKTTTFKTNEKGEIVDENGKVPTVPAGTYTVVVTDVPVGYEVKTGETGTVVVPKNDEGHHDAVITTDRGAIIITVTDEETGEPVENAEVEVITPSGEKKTFTTDENGQVTEYAKKDEFGNYTAEQGTYTYTVVKVPENYTVTVGEKQTGEVVEGKLTELEAKIATSTGGLDILVRDEKTKGPVKGATVEVIYPDGSTHTFITDSEGMVTELTKTDDKGRYLAKTGDYKITVIKVPEGYTVTTGQTKIETVERNLIKHHIAEIATATSTDSRVPQTDDDTPITMLFILMMLSAGGFAGVVAGKKKAKRK